MRRLVLLGAAIAAVTLLLGSQSMAARTEEPDFEVVARHDGFEVRRYAPTLEAHVSVDGTMRGAFRGGFRRLADFIFGGNDAGASIAMTTPVAAHAPPGDGDGWTVSFVMPRAWSADTLPRPKDPGVRIVDVPAQAWAVRSFSGFADDGAVATELAALRAAVDAAGVRVDARPVVAQFDPPWVVGPLRRNEVRLRVVE